MSALASDRKKIEKLKDKTYRDAFMATQVRGGIAYQMQAIRDQFGLSQSEFATKIGKPQSVVSRLENTEYGKVTVQTLLDIACALDIALLVRFADYAEFLARAEQSSPQALRVRDFSHTLWPAAAPAQNEYLLTVPTHFRRHGAQASNSTRGHQWTMNDLSLPRPARSGRRYARSITGMSTPTLAQSTSALTTSISSSIS